MRRWRVDRGVDGCLRGGGGCGLEELRGCMTVEGIEVEWGGWGLEGVVGWRGRLVRWRGVGGMDRGSVGGMGGEGG